jgi:hypothetical protein
VVLDPDCIDVSRVVESYILLQQLELSISGEPGCCLEQ